MGQDQSKKQNGEEESKQESLKQNVDNQEVIDEEILKNNRLSIPNPSFDIYEGGEEIDVINFGKTEEEKKALEALSEKNCEFIPEAIKNLKDKSKYKFIDSKTKSNSAQLLSNDRDNVFIKFFLTDYLNIQNQLKKGNGLLIESLIYNIIVNQWDKNNISPFFIKGKKFVKCGGYADFKQKIVDSVISEPDGVSIQKWLSKVDTKASSFTFDTQVYMSVTENLGKHIEFADWLNQRYQIEENITNQDFKAVIFQLAWNLLVLQKFKIRHNDLHLANICIQLLDNPKLFSFERNGKIISFETKYKLVFIDWDRSAIPGLEDYGEKVINANILGLCDLGFGCNNWNQGFDHYFIACLLNDVFAFSYKDDESIEKRKIVDSFKSGFLQQINFQVVEIEPKPQIVEYFSGDGLLVKRPTCYKSGKDGSEALLTSNLENSVDFWVQNMQSNSNQAKVVYKMPTKDQIDEFWNIIKNILDTFDISPIRIVN